MLIDLLKKSETLICPFLFSPTRCLREASFVCRSASYDAIGMTCDMSRLTARLTGFSDGFYADKNFDYFENECLIGETDDKRLCKTANTCNFYLRRSTMD